ncbi:transcriptional regulator [Enterococcus sp. JM4C]|uniref:ArsR/SmtB family transcription factor n=1 Tax=Candidatus Enterococcus huntleyi TaxID=1857217 RepID=UPI0013797328|nr:metalloregulator ArsR/SmtB family transcription factor [Enterococcus sp. JM4C]KAF1297220.1 transcriptional regulator [Enterococcus sp. JM4C]
MKYEEVSSVLKAMSDPNRVKIIHILSKGTMCACHVLEHFEFTQPTLSHHMKVLEKAGIVSVSKKSQWHYYSLKEDFVNHFMVTMTQLFSVGDQSDPAK